MTAMEDRIDRWQTEAPGEETELYTDLIEDAREEIVSLRRQGRAALVRQLLCARTAALESGYLGASAFADALDAFVNSVTGSPAKLEPPTQPPLMVYGFPLLDRDTQAEWLEYLASETPAVAIQPIAEEAMGPTGEPTRTRPRPMRLSDLSRPLSGWVVEQKLGLLAVGMRLGTLIPVSFTTPDVLVFATRESTEAFISENHLAGDYFAAEHSWS